MSKYCYWYYQYFYVDGEKIDYFLPGFRYGEYESESYKFQSFDELYSYAEKHPGQCEAKVSFFTKKRKVYINTFFEPGVTITEKNFSDVKIVHEYKPFNPTVKEAIEYLTVEQFKEYAGFSLRKEDLSL